MSSNTESQHVAPKYLGLLTSGIITAAVGAAGIVGVTTYGAYFPHAVTPGWTAILATTCVIGSGLILTAWGLRIVMGELAEIRTAVDAHAFHVAHEHGSLKEDLTDVRALVAGVRHHVQPEQKAQQHTPRQRKRRRRSGAGNDANVIPLRARRAADALRRLTERIDPDSPKE